MGAVFASGVALTADASTGAGFWVLILLAGIAGGMVWAGITAFLRDRFHASEILVSLMLVYVAIMALNFLVYGPWKDPLGYNFPQTKTFDAITQIPKLITGTRVNIGVLLALAGVLGGMVWAGLTAWLRDRFNASEILVSLMLVYVAVMVLNYLVYGAWKDPLGYNFPQTKTFDAVTQIPKLIPGTRVNVGVLLALAGVGCLWVFLFRTHAGFAQQVGGLAPDAARYAGFSSRRALWLALLTSGAAAGLAGALEVAGPLRQLTPFVPTGYGFAAIIVAFVGRLHPVGMVMSALLMSMFYIGGELAQSRLGLPRSLTGVFQGLLLFSLLACDTLMLYKLRWVSAAPPVSAMNGAAP
jgi:hypothetical protein